MLVCALGLLYQIRELSDFRPVVDRQQLKIRRQFTVETIVDPPTTTWWEAVHGSPLPRPHTGDEF